MYVCVCHALTDKQVREAAQGGVKTAGQMFKRHGVRPVCGKCVGCMKEVMGAVPAGGQRDKVEHV